MGSMVEHSGSSSAPLRRFTYRSVRSSWRGESQAPSFLRRSASFGRGAKKLRRDDAEQLKAIALSAARRNRCKHRNGQWLALSRNPEGRIRKLEHGQFLATVDASAAPRPMNNFISSRNF